METLEQLKEIVKNAPEGKTMVSECYGVHYYWSDRDLSDLSMRCESVYGVLRSLSGIKVIIEFMEGFTDYGLSMHYELMRLKEENAKLRTENSELYEESAKDKGL